MTRDHDIDQGLAAAAAAAARGRGQGQQGQGDPAAPQVHGSDPGASGAGGAAPDGGPRPIDPSREYVDKADYDRVAARAEQLQGDLQRVAADFENYKKRAAREREQAQRAASEKLLGELLAVLDDMERALEHAEQSAETHPRLADGVRMVHQRLDAVVSGHGLERVPVDGRFDPHLHEAMMMRAEPGVEDDTILEVVQQGWRLGDRVLRHARVIVAGGGGSDGGGGDTG